MCIRDRYCTETFALFAVTVGAVAEVVLTVKTKRSPTRNEQLLVDSSSVKLEAVVAVEVESLLEELLEEPLLEPPLELLPFSSRWSIAAASLVSILRILASAAGSPSARVLSVSYTHLQAASVWRLEN